MDHGLYTFRVLFGSLFSYNLLGVIVPLLLWQVDAICDYVPLLYKIEAPGAGVQQNIDERDVICKVVAKRDFGTNGLGCSCGK